MSLDIVQFLAGEDSGSHIAVLDPLIGQESGSEALAQIHGLEPFIVELGDLVVAGQELT